ncbi:tyrosine-protein phosphatase [Ewingella americana]|uniref:tyrosine-protein phosphatase n=1 Tax=Ewingella americana TaxID=41202 RepID=UPI0012AD2158|nr:tyrosine-protein phosphatase [Ewingella americana]MRT06105.1 protein-tyrosine-phosphatase [Ewingella americana]QMV53355.1 tyrosine-protein phosphatase [Ewingella americana]
MTATILLHPSLTPLEGGINFRELGGNTAADGRRIKRGWLYRSGSLDSLTPKDCDFLSKVPVAHILDYRDADEVAAKPDVLWQGVQYHHAPANPLSHEVSANLEHLTQQTIDAFDPETFMLELYRRLPFNNPAYQQLAKLLTQPNGGAIVQHCAVGKDRTGIGSALVLFALGADRNTVLEDYLLTETTLAPFRTYMLNKMSIKLNDKALEKFGYVLSVREAFMDTALKSIDDLYGSTDLWLEKEYGLTAELRQNLRDRYLE